MSIRTDARKAVCFLLVGLVASPGPVHAESRDRPTPIRVGNFPGFGRVAFDFASPTAFDVVEEGDRLLIVFDGSPVLSPGPIAVARPPRNVLAIKGGTGSATLVLAPGARFRASKAGSRVMVDVLDPTPDRPARAATRLQPPPPQAMAAAATAPPAQLVLDTGATPVSPAPVQPDLAVPDQGTAAPRPAPVIPVQQGPLRGPAAPSTITVAAAGPSTSIQAPAPPAVVTLAPARPASMLIPLDSSVGAAAFRRADSGIVVFDQRVPIDIGSIPGTADFAVSARLGQATTVLTVPLAPGLMLAMTREPQGWRLTRTDASSPAAAIQATPGAAGLLLNVENPGRVVTMADPLTGLALLIGTVIPASGVGPATTPARRTPGYALPTTWLGVVVEPHSDTVELRPITDGFLVAAPGMTPGGDTPVPTPTAFTRRFEFPDLAVPALQQRLQAQVAAAAAAPPRSRTPDRMAAAQSLLSLGLATEAQALLALVATEDPVAANDANLTGLMAIAALLAGRSHEAAGLDDPRLDGTDDVALWRGVRDAMRDADPDAGRGLPRLLPLASAYPAAMRDRLRPLVIEAAVAVGQAASVATALARADDPGLDFARALAHERGGNTAAALLAYDALAASREQLTQVRAGARAAELRLKQGAITPAQAADILERQAAIWRGDARESRMRLRAAANAFRPALDILRDTERLFPEQRPAVRAGMASVFRAMLSQPHAVPPLDLVTIASDYAPLLPDGAGGDLGPMLADKLVALDLPGRAGPVLDALIAAAAPGPARAGIAVRLAQMHVDAAAFPAAEATLRATDAPDLPPALIEQRILLLARARAAQGDLPAAVASLQALGTAPADELRATLLSQAADWPGSLAALADLAAKAIPAAGPLSNAMQDIVLRQASSAVHANDTALLADLYRCHNGRLAGPRADLFRLLMAEPVRSPADLPRTATELTMARLMPDRLQSLSARNAK